MTGVQTYALPISTRHGFDQYFGLPYSNDMMKKAKANGQNVVPLVRGEKVIELLTGDDQDHLTARYTDEAVKFISENINITTYGNLAAISDGNVIGDF